MTCSKCGAAMQDGAVFCANCGNRLSQEPGPESTAAAGAPDAEIMSEQVSEAPVPEDAPQAVLEPEKTAPPEPAAPVIATPLPAQPAPAAVNTAVAPPPQAYAPPPAYPPAPVAPTPAAPYAAYHPAPGYIPPAALPAQILQPPYPTKKFVGLQLLKFLPGIHFIIMLVFAFSGKNFSRRNYARSHLIRLAIIALVILAVFAVFLVLGLVLGGSLFASLGDGFGDIMSSIEDILYSIS